VLGGAASSRIALRPFVGAHKDMTLKGRHDRRILRR
jgi:hypothetical protein